MPFAFRLIPAAAAACLLASCGGGSGSAPGGGTTPPTATSGVAVDGYLAGSTVLCDENGNGVADAGERSVGTNASGQFSFAAGCTAQVIVTGGTSADTGLPFSGSLRAPAGATVVSPLTTLIAAGLSEAALLTALGLPSDTPSLLTTDPAATAEDGTLLRPTLLRQTLAVQQLTQKTAELFAGLGGVSGTATLQALYSQVATAFAGALASGAPLLSGSDIDTDAVARLVKAAAQSDELGDAVQAAVGALNADALAQVSAAGLATQAQSILNAADAEITATTRDAQSDDAVTSFISDNADALTEPPGPDTEALAEELAEQAGPAPTNYLALADDTIQLVNGSSVTSYTMSQFQSNAGISVQWKIPEPTVLRISGLEVGTYVIPAGQKLSAAMEIRETVEGGQGKLLGFVENVDVRKTSTGLEIAVPALGSGASAMVYGMSSDGAKQLVIDFADAVAGVSNTLRTTAVNNIVFGEVVNFAIERVSNDFTGIYGLRGKYQVSVVIDGLPLRKADGRSLPTVSIAVPTSLNSSGAVATTKTVSGPGLMGYITLTD